jgi:hypothetical protein
MTDPALEEALHVIHAGFLRLLAEGQAEEILKLEMNLRAIFEDFRGRLESDVTTALRAN